MQGKCPFGKCKCEECVLYRKGLRYYDTPGESGHGISQKAVPFEECAINIAVDCLENMVDRSIGQQKASEETRNEINKLNQLFYQLVNIKLLKNIEESNVVDGETV